MDIFSNSDFLCFAHRGASGYAADNSLKAMRKAVELGAPAIETDVQLVGGELVVYHNTRIELPDGRLKKVADYTLSEVRAVDIGEGERIPTLPELLECLDGRVALNIELKDNRSVPRLVQILKSSVAEGRWSNEHFIISSFNHLELSKFKAAMPGVKFGALTCGIPSGYAEFAAKLGAFSVNSDLDFFVPEMVEDAHRRGLKIYIYTVNDEADIKEMVRLGVDGIFCDYPDRAAKVLGRRSL